MKLSEDQIRDVVALKENIIEQIDSHQEAISMLEKNLTILDLTLKESSFTKASQLGTTGKAENHGEAEKIKPKESSIPIKRGNNGKTIANAFVTPEQLAIIFDERIQIKSDPPPFKSFFS